MGKRNEDNERHDIDLRTTNKIQKLEAPLAVGQKRTQIFTVPHKNNLPQKRVTPILPVRIRVIWAQEKHHRAS